MIAVFQSLLRSIFDGRQDQEVGDQVRLENELKLVEKEEEEVKIILEADEEEETYDEAVQPVDYLCLHRIGVITDLFSDHGVVDNEFKFKFNGLSVDLLKRGMKLHYVVFRKSVLDNWQVHKVKWAEEDWADESSSEPKSIIEKKSFTIERTEVGQVDHVEDRTVFVPRAVGLPDIKFCLDDMTPSFVPVKGDWLSMDTLVEVDPKIRDFCGEILSIRKYRPLRSRTFVGHVSFWNKDCFHGAIDSDVWFLGDACDVGYDPRVGDQVAVEVIESSFNVYSWRAITVTLMKQEDQDYEDNIASFMPNSRTLANRKQDCRVLNAAEKEVNGIYVTCNLNFGIVNMGETKRLEARIWNKGYQRQCLLRGRFHGKKKESQLIVSGLKDYTFINPGEQILFHFQCEGKFLGISNETFGFAFRGFKLMRILEVEVHDPHIMKHISINGSYNDNRSDKCAKARDRHELEMRASPIKGESPFKAPSFIPGQLDNFNIKPCIWNAVCDDISSAFHEQEISRRLENEVKTLASDLTPGNYSENMHTFLQLEELHKTIELEQFNMDGVTLTFSGPGQQYLALEIPGLAEKRPSILIGDKLRVYHPTIRENPYDGYVHKVCSKEVLMKFDTGFHLQYSGEPVSVYFVLSRNTFRRLHTAVDLVLKNLGSDFLFPGYFELKKPQLVISGRISYPQAVFQEDTSVQENEATKERLPESQVVKKKFEIHGINPTPIAPKTPKRPVKIRWFNKSLNEHQRMAITNVLAGEARPLPYIIFGPPGTGKTITIVELVLQIYHLIPGSRILLATPSNSSANLLTQRLLDADVLRPGELVRVVPHHLLNDDSNLPESLRPYATTIDISLTASRKPATFTRKLQQSSNAGTIGRYRITVGTCGTIGQLYALGLPPGHFTHVCVDEAGQTSEPECLIPLVFLHKDWGQSILVGDPKQLGPVVSSPFAKKYGLGVSFLARILDSNPYKWDSMMFKDHDGFNPNLVTRLIINYRTLPELLELPSSLFYDGCLRPQVDKEKSKEAVLLKSLSSILPKRNTPLPPAVVFHGVRGTAYQEEDSPSWCNPLELVQVSLYVKQLIALGVSTSHIGVITPYQKQVAKLRDLLSNFGIEPPKIGSVEEFQGQERMVIIVSTVRSSTEHMRKGHRRSLGFVADPHRLNVLLTRARALLIIVGNPFLLSRDPFWKHTLSYCLENDAFTGCDAPRFLVDTRLESPEAN